MNTDISTSVMPMIGPNSSSIALIAASCGVRPRSMWCATPSTITIASSTTMPIARTMREQRRQVDGEAERRHRGEGADDGHRDGGRRHQRGAPVLQEHQDHDQHQDAGLEQRLVDLVDRGLDEPRGVERHAVGQALREGLRQLGHLGVDRGSPRPARWRRAAGRWRCRPPACRSAWKTASRSARRARPAPTSFTRVIWPPLALSILTMMLANSAGSASRPSTLTVYWKSWPAGAGGVPTWPAVTCWLCCWIALITSCGVSPRACKLLRIEPDAHRILPDAEHVDVADARQAGQLVDQVDGGVVAEEQAVVAAVRRGQRDDLQDRGRLLLHGHALRLHRLRQRGQRRGDAVLHQHLREVRGRCRSRRSRSACRCRRSALVDCM